MAEGKSKKGKNRRKPKTEIARYWNINHITNMVRRARHVFRYWIRIHAATPVDTMKRAQMQRDRFVSLHSNNCNACKNILQARVSRES